MKSNPLPLEIDYRAWARRNLVIDSNSQSAEMQRIDLSRAFTFAGATRIRFGELPSVLIRKIKANILRGYSVTRQGNSYHWSRLVVGACPVETIRLGFICHQYMDFFICIPYEEQQAFRDGLQALCAVTGKVQANRINCTLVNSRWLNVKGVATRGGYRDTTGEPNFKEVRLFVDSEMKKTLHTRQRIVEWFESGPEATIPFTSYKDV